jgi:ABC-type uncharacterized transport system permease subunit
MQTNQSSVQMPHSLKLVSRLTIQNIAKMKKTINTILSILFPFKELNSKVSVLSEQSWLEKVMTTPQLKDYLWTAK